MKNVPLVCVDGFYEDPDEVRKFALSQMFVKSSDGRWPGWRTQNIANFDENFYYWSCRKLLSLFVDLEHSLPISWNIETSFQIIESLHERPESPKNMGWIHNDSPVILSAIIYLTPDIDENTGLSIYGLKPNTDEDLLFQMLDKSSDAKVNFYKNKIDNNYDEIMLEHRKLFTETMKFDNVYNRLIAFDGSDTWHGVRSYHTNVPRLTQTFFVNSVDIDQKFTIERLRNVKYEKT